MNPFVYETAAERYAHGRPEYHELIIEKIRSTFEVDEMFARALDVGCGTGMSSRALRAIADRVDGLDSSAAMLAQAEPLDGVYYHVGEAEELPFSSGSFEIATVSSAFHWFDRGQFLVESKRVLRPPAYLVVYENSFPGVMESNAEFTSWQQSYYDRFPRPPRDRSPFTDDDALAAGFEFVSRETYTNMIEFTPTELSLYLSSQSNAIEAIERGSTSVDELRSWIEAEVTPFFGPQTRARFEFRGHLWCLKRVEQ